MKKIKLKQIKSSIGMNSRQKSILRSLNLGRIGKISEFELNDSTQGRVNLVKHVIEVTL